MEFKIKQQEIDGILKTLDEAKRYSGLGPDDPAVVELERIMIAKVAELEAAKTEAAKALPRRSGTGCNSPTSTALCCSPGGNDT